MTNLLAFILIMLGVILLVVILGVSQALLLLFFDKRDEVRNITRCHSCHHFESRLLGGYCYLKEEKCDSEGISCNRYEKEEDGTA